MKPKNPFARPINMKTRRYVDNMTATADCPVCVVGIGLLQSRPEARTYLGKPVTADAYFYKCGLCGEEFTTTATDEVTVENIIKAANLK